MKVRSGLQREDGFVILNFGGQLDEYRVSVIHVARVRQRAPAGGPLGPEVIVVSTGIFGNAPRNYWEMTGAMQSARWGNKNAIRNDITQLHSSRIPRGINVKNLSESTVDII